MQIGVCIQGVVGLHPGRVGQTPPPPEQGKREARILLECCLVLNKTIQYEVFNIIDIK